MLSTESSGAYVADDEEVTAGNRNRSLESTMPPQALKKLGALFGRSEAASKEAPSELRGRERRVQPRFTTLFRSTFSGQRREGQGRTLDISAGGCKIESDMTVQLGGKFECRLHVPGLDWPLRIDEATVRWVEGNTFGIGFTRISPEELHKLRTVLKKLEDEG